MTGRATHRGRTKLVQEQGAPQERFARAACSASSCPPHQPPSPPSPGQMSLVYLPDVIQMQDVDNFHLLLLLLFTILFIFSPPPGYARCHLHTSDCYVSFKTHILVLTYSTHHLNVRMKCNFSTFGLSFPLRHNI